MKKAGRQLAAQLFYGYSNKEKRPRRVNAAGAFCILTGVSNYISVVRTFFSLAKRGREFSWGTFSSPWMRGRT